MITYKLTKPGFIFASLLLLALGILGNRQAIHRPTGHFRCENRGNTVVVTNIVPGGVGQRAGLQPGDIIIKVANQAVQDQQELEFLFDIRKPGNPVTLAIQRDIDRLTINLTLAGRYSTDFLLINLLLGLLFWMIGIFVYLNKPDDLPAQVFFGGCTSVSTIIMMIWTGYPYDAAFIDLLRIALYFILYSLTPAIFLYFSLVYPGKKRLVQKFNSLACLLFMPALVFIGLLVLPYLIAIRDTSLTHYINFYHFYDWFRVYFFVYVITGIGCMVHTYRTSDTRASRQKIQWIFWGICFGASPFLFLWYLPDVFGNPFIPEAIAYLFIMIIPLSFGVSIVKYQALDIEIVLNRSIVYTIITGIIILLYLALVSVTGLFFHSLAPSTSNFLAIAYALVAAILFSPIKRKIQTFVDQTFYQVKYNYRLAITDFGRALASVLHPDDLPNLIIEKIDHAIPVEKIAMILPDLSGQIFTVAAGKGLSSDAKNDLVFNSKSQLVQVLTTDKSALAKKDRHKHLDAVELVPEPVLEKLAIELVLPIIMQNQLKGFILLGKKKSGTRFYDDDLELIIPLAEDGLMAFDRLKLQEMIFLEKAEKDKLEEVNRLKSEFISHVSHELRTPLTSICWSVENLLDGIPEQPGPKIRDYLTGIYDSSKHLDRMIENLLDLTRIEAGRIEIYPVKLDLATEIHKALEVSRPIAEKKDIRLETLLIPGLHLQADPDYLQEILINLLDNAIKYSNAGALVQVETKIFKPGENRINATEMVAISVIDHGFGIPLQKQQSIFDRFERIKQEKAAREKGLGLGLHIVKKLVELQGGHIWLESTIGQGSTFTFTLPLAH